MLPFAEQLQTLIAAPYPFVNLVTFEEERVTAMLKQLAAAMSRTLASWRPELGTRVGVMPRDGGADWPTATCRPWL